MASLATDRMFNRYHNKAKRGEIDVTSEEAQELWAPPATYIALM